MASSPPANPEDPEPSSAAAAAAAHAYFDGCRARVDGFVRDHFGLRGTLRLHRAALGLDLLRAPLNVLLAPLHVLITLVAIAAARLRLRRLAGWLRRRDILLDTDVGRAVAVSVVTELLRLPRPVGSRSLDDEALADAMASMPPLRARAGPLDEPDARTALERRTARALRDYAGTRGAVAEATTALATLGVGALVFGTLTPGMVSMAPSVAAALSLDAALSRFPFGETLGGWWYGVFPASVPAWLFAATLLALMSAGAVFAAFAGIVADPLQKRSGIHRRRLLRLVDALESEVTDTLSPGFSAPEHYYARLFDLVDASVSFLRLFRG